MPTATSANRTASFDPNTLPTALAPTAVSLLAQSLRHEQVDSYVAEALPLIATSVQANFAARVVADGGRWTVRSQFGKVATLPLDFLADVVDRNTVSQSRTKQGLWLGAPLEIAKGTPEVLLMSVPEAAVAGMPPNASAQLAALAGVFTQGLHGVRGRDIDHRRLRRLEAILDIAGQWNQAREMEPLLVLMAEAATRLLAADRASIFLWDKASHTLVGRPALGVKDGELRIPDNVGVVGQVLATGETRRVDVGRDESEIHRKVDTELGYQTQSLLCVPLIGRSGERFGAFEVLNKRDGNFTLEDEAALRELAEHAAIALENTQERTSLLDIRRRITEQAAEGVRLIGDSPAIQALRSTIQRVATTELAVLILGENGTGKEVVSQSIHYLSNRRDKPFIAVNCAAITETLLEAELFGHEKGAFTDARESRAGKFELASGGTLFLDEIGDMSLGGQSKLLRVLEEKIVVRVGGSTPIHTDTRVLAATNQDLAAMVRSKKFREDLYFRLNVVSLDLPPLRDRGEDALLLAEHFLADFCAKARRKVLKFSAEARRRMLSHAWPGNVRELRNLMERLAYLSQGDRVEAEELAFILSPSAAAASELLLDMSLPDATDRFQVEYIGKVVARVKGNVSEAAKLLGLHRSNLYRKMRQLGMEVPD